MNAIAALTALARNRRRRADASGYAPLTRAWAAPQHLFALLFLLPVRRPCMASLPQLKWETPPCRLMDSLFRRTWP
jgi:hypothetical protein